MPSPVAANDLYPISGSVQTSRISYAVEPAGKDYGQNYNGTHWYSDIPNDGTRYTIVSDNYTANYYISRSLAGGAYPEGGLPAVDEYSAPVFWITTGTSSLDVITTVNGLPDRVGETPFNSGSQALNWIASSSNYFAVGPDYYRDIDADQLQLYLEGNQVISYPTTGSTWYDVSGNGKNGTLVNGPVWDSDGWFTFDGSDDYISGPLPNQNPEEATLEVWYKTTADEPFPGENRLLFLGDGFTNGISLRLRDDKAAFFARKGDNSGYWDLFSGATVIDGNWKHLIGTFDTASFKRYENGVLTQQTSTGQTYLTASSGYSLGGPTYYFDGSIAKARFYSKRLTADEVLQNYYGGPIVTDGLVYHVNFGNLVSYPKSGTTAYDMTGTMTTTSLVNGPTFTTNNGGTLLFDGADDYCDNADTQLEILNNVTINAWIRHNGTGSSVGNYMSKAQNFGYRMRRNGGNGLPLWLYSAGNSINGGAIYDNIWYMVTGVFSDTGLRAYINGQLVASNSTPYSPSNLAHDRLYLGSYNGAAELFGGEIAMAQIYDKALTQEEIQQNYNATN